MDGNVITESIKPFLVVLGAYKHSLFRQWDKFPTALLYLVSYRVPLVSDACFAGLAAQPTQSMTS